MGEERRQEPRQHPVPRVLVADDHQPIHALIRRIIEPEFEVIGAVTNGRDLISRTLELGPDALVVDIQMPVLSGIQAVRELFLKIANPLPVVFLTSQADPSLVASALAAGGRGYVLKTLADRHLTEALREALDGRVYLCPKVRHPLRAGG